MAGYGVSEKVVVRKPDTHAREYSFLQLDNGLKAIIGSDPACDKAGAGLCVNVGMCHERKDLPGLAHFLEHMLFTGTTKYPKEGEYHEFIQQNGGAANAYTACYFTNYMFEIKPEALVETLDRFAGFFTEPLLTRDCTEREINAVDSEYQAGLTSPWWRYVGILNMSANPDHPFHVAVGNNKVLLEDPKERGIDLYEEMKQLYDSTYSANGMTLCVFGKEPTAQMEEILREKFGSVRNKGLKMPIGDTVSDKPPFVPAEWHQLLLQNPVQDVKDLTFSWVIPYQAPFWRLKPAEYISHLLGHEGKGSIIAALKQQGLISACSAGNGGWLEGAFSLLNVTFELTEKGLDAVEEIGRYLFAYLGMLQKSAPEKRIFEEARRLSEIRFKFKEDASPFQLCPDIALSLQKFPPSEALSGNIIHYEFDPDAITQLLTKLTLTSVRVQFQAKSLAERCTQKDTSYGSPMELCAIDQRWLDSWATVLKVDGTLEESREIATKMGLHLPPPNPFIPEDLSLKTAPSDNQVVPQLVTFKEPDVQAVSIFHRQDDLFQQPKAQVTFYIYSPYFQRDAASYLKTTLWSQCVEEALQEYAYDAQIAGVGYSLQLSGGSLKLVLAGFNDKLHVLLEAVTQKMVSMSSVPDHIFSIIMDTFTDDLRNQAYHSQPIQQASMRFEDLLNRGSSFPVLELLEILPQIQRSDLDNLCQNFFVEGSHVEALTLGNLTVENVKHLSQKLVTGLKLSKPLKSLPYRAEAQFPDGITLWKLDSVDVDDPNHAVMMKLQLPEGLEDEMQLMLLDKVLSAKFFEILRTQQQLGYIVQMAGTVSLKFPTLIALAQTEFPPDYVRGCIAKFMAEHFEFIQKSLTEDEFKVCQNGLISQLRMKPKNLREEARRFARQLNERSFDFARRERGARFVEQTTLEQFRSYVTETVMKAPQIYVQIKKVLEKDDKPLPSGASQFPDPTELRQWTGNESTVEAFGSTARWLPVNASLEVSGAKL